MKRIVVLGMVLGLSACASSEGQRRVWTPEEPTIVGQPVATPAPSVPARPLPPPGISDAPGQPQRAEDLSGAAVTALMRQARTALDAGAPQQAASALERALRIEPRNPFVWSLLGEAYLAQANYAQADSVAAKSNALAHGNPWVELQNWRTIANARAALGDPSGESAARQRVRELEQWLQDGGGR
ncbi:tetratricopeptide repeat protein [Sinimarinibacterium thermocellulolyticum]|uniref:Tetratricopeptide repeat protein n=1 Tax=Sinimarinibacterium thermocellulolyticum TaxID=3170016 RepID=A0ABV2AAR0_9GAMM